MNLWESETTHCHARRIGGIVYIRSEVSNGLRPGVSDWVEFTRLPEGMKPEKTIYVAATDLAGEEPVNVRISSSGLISAISSGHTVGYWTFSTSFPAA